MNEMADLKQEIKDDEPITCPSCTAKHVKAIANKIGHRRYRMECLCTSCGWTWSMYITMKDKQNG